MTSRDVAIAGLRRAVYLLDRSLAPSVKVRAFRSAIVTIGDLSATEFSDRLGAGTLTELDGVGPSTARVMTETASEGIAAPGSYLDALEQSTVIDAGSGSALRASLRGDCHLHTTWSDGGASLAEMATTAIVLGHDYIVVTDHSPRLTIAHGLTSERLAEQRREVEELNRRFDGFQILRGSEVDILADGGLDFDDEVLADLDIVVASVHSKLAMERTEMTRRMVHAVSNPHVDILGHCTGRQILGTPRPPSTFDADVVFAACAAAGTAVEINCRPERMDPPDELLAVALDAGCDVVISTDAHAPGQLEWQAYGCIKAANHQIEPDRIVNTRSAEELLNWAGAA